MAGLLMRSDGHLEGGYSYEAHGFDGGIPDWVQANPGSRLTGIGWYYDSRTESNTNAWRHNFFCEFDIISIVNGAANAKTVTVDARVTGTRRDTIGSGGGSFNINSLYATVNGQLAADWGSKDASWADNLTMGPFRVTITLPALQETRDAQIIVVNRVVNAAGDSSDYMYMGLYLRNDDPPDYRPDARGYNGHLYSLDRPTGVLQRGYGGQLRDIKTQPGSTRNNVVRGYAGVLRNRAKIGE